MHFNFETPVGFFWSSESSSVRLPSPYLLSIVTLSCRHPFVFLLERQLIFFMFTRKKKTQWQLVMSPNLKLNYDYLWSVARFLYNLCLCNLYINTIESICPYYPSVYSMLKDKNCEKHTWKLLHTTQKDNFSEIMRIVLLELLLAFSFSMCGQWVNTQIC